LLGIANKDKDKLHNFIRLVDYMTIEVLVDINFASVKTFMDEMRKERKTGLFNISINEQQMTFMPDEEEILDLIETTLKDMIEIVRGIPRFIREFKEYLKFNQGEDDRMDNIADIGKIITRSVEYIAIKSEMQEKVKVDFTVAAAYVEENYKKVR
jgi:dynein heavy chain